MVASQDIQRDGTVTFLPHHLNRQPVVVRGLTADELWICTGLSASVGLLLGVAVAWLTSAVAMAPTFVIVAVAAGVFCGGAVLRREKRRRPDTWLHRQIQWRIALRHPGFAPYVGGKSLITRSGYWTTRRRMR
jgi:conjugative transfer region protein (TIGR03750 family)